MERIMFKKNVGSVDKVIRIVLGIGIIGAGIYFQNWLGAIGVVPLLTGIFGTCGLYSLFGINTCKIK
jgi:hypothetical protein